MDLEQFAKLAGVELVECDPEWGGRIGYREKSNPNSTTAGFRSNASAYRHWLESTFGGDVAKAVKKLLAQTKRPQP